MGSNISAVCAAAGEAPYGRVVRESVLGETARGLAPSFRPAGHGRGAVNRLANVGLTSGNDRAASFASADADSPAMGAERDASACRITPESRGCPRITRVTRPKASVAPKMRLPLLIDASHSAHYGCGQRTGRKPASHEPMLAYSRGNVCPGPGHFGPLQGSCMVTRNRT